MIYWPFPSSQEILYFLPALYFKRLRVEEVFQELSGFLCSALSPKIRCSPAQSAKLYSLSKDLAGRNPQSSCNFDSSLELDIQKHTVRRWDEEHVGIMSSFCSNLLRLFCSHICNLICGLCTITVISATILSFQPSSTTYPVIEQEELE